MNRKLMENEQKMNKNEWKKWIFIESKWKINIK